MFCLFLCLFICLFVCLFTLLVCLYGLFPPSSFFSFFLSFFICLFICLFTSSFISRYPQLFVEYSFFIIIQLYFWHLLSRALSSVVEHRTAVPVVTGSIPVVPFFITLKKVNDKLRQIMVTQYVKFSKRYSESSIFLLLHFVFIHFIDGYYDICLFISYFPLLLLYMDPWCSGSI